MSKPLPGWSYMIIGIAIMAYTRFIQAKQPSSSIGLFFWIGLAFLVFGILREFVPRVMARKEKREPVGPPVRQQHVQQYGTHHTHMHLRPQQHPSHPYQPLHKQCPRCHQLTHSSGKFCQHCGHQFF